MSFSTPMLDEHSGDEPEPFGARLKGLREALHGLAAFRAGQRGLCLLVAGRGRRAKYERLASRLGLPASVRPERAPLCSVRFLGERNDMERLLGASDVLVHPTWYDPCSLVVLEALGAGVPVITTRFNGASELMRSGEEGFVLSDPADARRLAAQALGRLPDEQRAVIVARIWGGLTFEEVAEAVGCSASAAHRRYHAGLEALRERLGEPCSTKTTPMS